MPIEPGGGPGWRKFGKGPSRRILIMGILFGLGAASFLFLSRAGLFASKSGPGALSPVDKAIFLDMFRARVDRTRQLPWVLMSVSPGFDPAMPPSELKTLFLRHRAIHQEVLELERDPRFISLIQNINRDLVARLGPRPTRHKVRHEAYQSFLNTGLFEEAVRRAEARGMPHLVDVPESARVDDNYDVAIPGVTASCPLPEPQFPCTSLFWFCPTAGRIDPNPAHPKKGGALTLNDFGYPLLKRCRVTLQQLLENDPHFAA